MEPLNDIRVLNPLLPSEWSIKTIRSQQSRLVKSHYEKYKKRYKNPNFMKCETPRSCVTVFLAFVV